MAKAKPNKQRHDRQGQQSKPPAESIKLGAFVMGMSAFGRFADKFGTSFAILVFVVLTVRFLGKEDTWDDFLREALFGQITHRPWLGIILGILIIDAAIGGWTIRRWLSSDSKEMRRIADEKSRLQEELIGRKLHHTNGGTARGLTEPAGSPILPGASSKKPPSEEEPS